jgi:hypothetical protein
VKTLQPLGKIADPSIVGNTATAFFLPDGRLLVCYKNGATHIGIWKIDKTNPED